MDSCRSAGELHGFRHCERLKNRYQKAICTIPCTFNSENPLFTRAEGCFTVIGACTGSTNQRGSTTSICCRLSLIFVGSLRNIPSGNRKSFSESGAPFSGYVHFFVHSLGVGILTAVPEDFQRFCGIHCKFRCGFFLVFLHDFNINIMSET